VRRHSVANRITCFHSRHFQASRSYGNVDPPSAMRVLFLFWEHATGRAFVRSNGAIVVLPKHFDGELGAGVGKVIDNAMEEYPVF
jgi:hypothetical protein